MKHPRLPDYRAVALPIKWDGERPAASRVPPLLGEHSADKSGRRLQPSKFPTAWTVLYQRGGEVAEVSRKEVVGDKATALK